MYYIVIHSYACCSEEAERESSPQLPPPKAQGSLLLCMCPVQDVSRCGIWGRPCSVFFSLSPFLWIFGSGYANDWTMAPSICKQACDITWRLLATFGASASYFHPRVGSTAVNQTIDLDTALKTPRNFIYATFQSHRDLLRAFVKPAFNHRMKAEQLEDRGSSYIYEGKFYHNGKLFSYIFVLCVFIELPWNENMNAEVSN